MGRVSKVGVAGGVDREDEVQVGRTEDAEPKIRRLMQQVDALTKRVEALEAKRPTLTIKDKAA